MRWATVIALVGGLGMLAATATAHRAGGCTAVGTWAQNTPGIASTTWTITSDGKADERNGPGNLPPSAKGISASGTGTLAGQTLTITFVSWDTVTTGVLKWTLTPDCRSGQGTLTLTGPPSRPDVGKPYPSTVTGSGSTATTTSGQTTTTTATTGQTAGVGSVSGEVTVLHADGQREPVTTATKLRRGDRLETGLDSEVKLKFTDGTVMTVSEMTQLIVADLLSKGSRQATVVELKLGEVSAQINPKHAFQSDFKVKFPCTELAPATLSSPAIVECAASVRGSKMRVFYDPAAKTGIVATLQDVSSFTPPRKGAKTIAIPVGKEIAVTPAGVSRLAPIGKAGARGGIDVEVAAERVLKLINRMARRCKLASSGGVGVLPAGPAGWAVSVPLQGNVTGISTWQVTSGKVTPQNAAAKTVASGC